VSSLGLSDAEVLTVRIEALKDVRPTASADLITMRAVRPDSKVLAAAHRLLKLRGFLVLFRGSVDGAEMPSEFVDQFSINDRRALTPSSGFLLTLSKAG
jgi:16S rRNA G527 N7-methylase RsmG